MKHMSELRDKLSKVFEDLHSKRIELATAKEMVNAAGKIINSVNIELKGYELAKKEPNIPFIASKDSK
jgi:hypothetical protein